MKCRMTNAEMRTENSQYVRWNSGRWSICRRPQAQDPRRVKQRQGVAFTPLTAKHRTQETHPLVCCESRESLTPEELSDIHSLR